MFNLSFLEIIVIAVVGILVVGPEELPSMIKKVRNFINSARSSVEKILNDTEEQTGIGELKKEAESINHSIKNIVDLDGNNQQAYDVDEVMDDLKKYNMNQNKDSS